MNTRDCKHGSRIGDCIRCELAEAEARIDELEKQVAQQQKSNRLMMKAVNRRVDIENILIQISNGQLPILTKEGCRMLALRLGTDEKGWPDIVRDYDFG